MSNINKPQPVKTRLRWRRTPLAALAGILTGIVLALIVMMVVDAMPKPCSYHAPMQPILGCDFELGPDGP